MDYPVRVKKLASPKTITIGAGARRIVERKKAGLKFCQVVAAVRAGIACREKYLLGLGGGAFFPWQHLHQGKTVSDGECRLKRLCETLGNVRFDNHAVDDDINAVFTLAIQFGRGIQFMDYAIDPRQDKALAEQTLKQLLIFSLAILNHRCE